MTEQLLLRANKHSKAQQDINAEECVRRPKNMSLAEIIELL